MSLSNPRCKAFCQRVEQGLWVLIFLAILGLMIFSFYKVMTTNLPVPL